MPGRLVVCAIPLSDRARAALAGLLGDGHEVVDIVEAPDDCDVVLAPSSSPQLVGRLKVRFPSATVVVVELEDGALGVDLAGPVRRLLRQGADDYVVATSTAALAAALRARDEGAPVEAPSQVFEPVAVERRPNRISPR